MSETSLSAIRAVLEQKKQEQLAKTEVQVAKQVSDRVNLDEGFDPDTLKRITKSSPAAKEAAWDVLDAMCVNPKQNVETLISKLSAKHKISAEKVKSIFTALGVNITGESTEPTAEIKESEIEEDVELTELEDHTAPIVEDWVPMAKVKPGSVEKVKTKKSGNNFFYVVSFDAKDKTFEVVTPKAFNDGDTDKTMTVAFSDVVMASTDSFPEDGEKGGKKYTGYTLHKAGSKDADDEDEEDKKSKKRSANKAVKDMEVDESELDESVAHDLGSKHAKEGYKKPQSPYHPDSKEHQTYLRGFNQNSSTYFAKK